MGTRRCVRDFYMNAADVLVALTVAGNKNKSQQLERNAKPMAGRTQGDRRRRLVDRTEDLSSLCQ